jgi:hypothetical protein
MNGPCRQAVAKPFFCLANSWGMVAGVRWADRVGKGIRRAPRDALVADTVAEEHRGLAFGLHRAADTGGAVLGLIVALLVVWRAQAGGGDLRASTLWRIAVGTAPGGLLGRSGNRVDHPELAGGGTPVFDGF